MKDVFVLVYNIHSMTDKACDFVGRQIERLEAMEASGWAPEAMPMRDLYNDARALRTLAAQLDNLREKMTQTEAA